MGDRRGPYYESLRRSFTVPSRNLVTDIPDGPHDYGDRPNDKRLANMPRLPVYASPPSRHELISITAKSWVRKGINSIALPGIDTHSEIALIALGYGDAREHDRYGIHGRVYAQTPDGKMYPESGEGIVRLSRMEFRALQLLTEHNGRTLGFKVAISREQNMTPEVIEAAMDVFNLRKEP